MKPRPPVPDDVLARLRSICLQLPEASEEAAWTGIRWRIRKKTFAHALVIAEGWPPAYAMAAETDGPACILTFRSILAQADDQAFAEPPFFRPVWWPDIAGIVLGDQVSWDEVSSLIAASYRHLAPKTLAEHV